MKLIKESLTHTFTQGKVDKLSTLGVGKVEMIKSWLEKMGVIKYTINDDLTIDTRWDVDLNDKNIRELPEYIQFNNITLGSFSINDNDLVTLRGCPKNITYGFWAEYNAITNLDFLPEKIGTSYHIYGCDNITEKQIKIAQRKYKNKIISNYNPMDESVQLKLNESPDFICKNGYNRNGQCILNEKPYLYHNATDALSFGYSHMEDPIILGLPKEDHSDLGMSRYVDFYLGRIWLKHKIISFWKYPETRHLLKKIINDIENELLNRGENIIIWNDPNFMIEIIDRKIIINDNDDFKTKSDWRNFKEIYTKLIPIKEYSGSLDTPEEWLNTEHNISPLNKHRKEVPKNTGSNRYNIKKPLELRQYLQTENLKFPKL